MTQAESINLKECLVPNPDPNPARPFNYHDRTHHLLPDGKLQLQEEVMKIVAYCESNQMRVNESKSKVMIFNTGRRYDVMPRLALQEDNYLQVVDQFKLLWVVLRSDLKWYDNTDYICKKGYARLWMLRRLKGLGANEEEILDVYQK